MGSTLASSVVNETSIVKQLDKSLLSSLLDDAKIIQLTEHENLFRFGQPATHFYWIKRGEVALYRPCYSGEEKIFRTLKAGDTVAETSREIGRRRVGKECRSRWSPYH